MNRLAFFGALMLGVLAWAIAGSAVADQPDSAANHFPPVTDTRDCDDDADADDNTITFQGAKVLWPPNHKYRTVTIVAEGRDNDDVGDDTDVRLTTAVASDQPDNGIGDGNTTDDASPAAAMDPPSAADPPREGLATTAHQLRGERAGKDPLKAGRTYTITATAQFDSEECVETFEVKVPHDMRDKKSL